MIIKANKYLGRINTWTWTYLFEYQGYLSKNFKLCTWTLTLYVIHDVWTGWDIENQYHNS